MNTATRSFEPFRAVLSGSFKRDKDGLTWAYRELVATSCQVLSPHRMEFDDSEFVRDSAEKYVSVREIQNHHLTAIAQSDFVWLHAPKGYVGSSAALEIGFAIAHRIPVFSRHRPSDVTLQEYVRTVSSVYDALSLL